MKLIINRLKIYPLNDLKNWPLKSSWLDQVENDLTEKKDVNWMDANLPGHVRKRDLENWTRTYQSQFLSSHFWQYQGIDFSSVVKDKAQRFILPKFLMKITKARLAVRRALKTLKPKLIVTTDGVRINGRIIDEATKALGIQNLKFIHL